MSKHAGFIGGMRSALSIFLFVVLLFNMVFSVNVSPVRAEGSKELVASGLGKRALTEWRTNTTAGLYRRTFFRVYAKPGEYILMGSSAMGLNLGDIVLYTEGQVSNSQIAPASLSAITPTFVCSTDGGGSGVLRGVDSATTRSMELQGATRNGGVDGGYIPCVYTVPAGGTGTYWVAMYGPLGASGATDGSAGTIAAPVIDATQQAGVSVWDITVRSGSATTGTDKPGRVFVDYLAQITGGNGPTRQVYSTLYAATNDGYVYRVDLNGLDPNGFILYGNRVGFLDPDGKTPLYHDVVTDNNQLNNPQAGVTLPPASAMIFFSNPLTSDLPASILPAPVPPTLTNVSYLGSAGGITGYQPIGGQFTYTGNVGGISEIVISRDGVDFQPDNPLNRVIRSQAVVGTNVVDWDGKDNAGAFFPVGNGYKYRVTFHAGEYHFPLLDAENSPNGGPSLTLLNPIGGVCPFNPNCHTGFYDDRGYMVTTGTVVGTVGATLPGPPNGINPPTTNNAINGFDTSTNQRAWGDSAASSSVGFGNFKGLDLWSYIPVGPVEVTLNVIASVAADLRIVKSHTGQFNIGPSGGTFTINVSNVGTGAVAGSITVTDTLPAGLTPVSATTPVGSGWDPCSIAGQLVTCVHPNGAGLAVGASLQPITLTVDVALSAAPSVINTATLSNANDTNPTNNSYSDPVTVNSADVGVEKSVLPIEAMEGATVVFTIKATNNGPSDATGIVLDDLLPAGLTYVSSTTTQGTYNSTTGVWTIGSLPNTASATMTITATIDAGTAGTSLTNTASRSASSPPDYDPTNDSASAILRVLNPSMTVVKSSTTTSLSAPGTVTYSYLVSNTGDVALTGVTLTDDNDNDDMSCPATTLAPAATMTCTATHTFTQAELIANGSPTAGSGSLTNNVTASSNESPNATDNLVIPIVATDLALTKSVNNSSPILGETVIFTITIMNQHLTTTATNIVVDDVLPAGLTFISATPSVGSYNSGTGDWSIASLTPSTSATLLLNVRVDQVGLITNTAEIVAVDQTDVDSTPGNHDPNEDDQASASVGSLFDPPSGIKTFSEAGLPQLEFRLVWINSGNSSAIHTQIIDNIPAGTTYVIGSVACAPQGSSSNDVAASAPLNTALANSFCTYDPINNRIQWQGSIGPDNGNLTEAAAANEVIITFRVTVADTVNEVRNTSMSRTDTDGDEDFTDETVVGLSLINSNEVVWTRDVTLPRALPDTGFAPNVITALPRQPAAKSYSATDVWLEIPRTGVNIPIVGVPLVDKEWDVTWLWQEAGWLNGTAFPGWSGNSVLTSHVTLSNGKPGPFAALGTLKWGDRIIVHAYGSAYTFEVRENREISPSNTSVLKHEEESWLTLLTCKTYNEKTDSYSKRLAVRAVLLKVELEKQSNTSER
ncbi:MAG: sortase [Chloroflexi bacterium]|nr:sortase [Chloroflexota bacterium]